MLKKVMKHGACIAGSAAVVSAISAIIVANVVFGGAAHEAGWHFFLLKLFSLFALSLPFYLVTAALVLGIALFVRRTRLPLPGCFAVAWILASIGVAVVACALNPNLGRSPGSLFGVGAGSAILIGIQALASALFHVWLFRKAAAAADRIF